MINMSTTWDDGKGTHSLGYSMPSERTAERRATIIAQVRAAKAQNNVESYNSAIDAAYWYCPTLYNGLKKICKEN